MKKKILIIEDDQLIVRAYLAHLERDGYKVETALDGKEGLEKVKSFKPDLILLDIIMPMLDGISTLKILKKDKETKKIPVILLTNVNEKDDVVLASKLGVLLYFVKVETSLKVLSKWVRDILK